MAAMQARAQSYAPREGDAHPRIYDIITPDGADQAALLTANLVPLLSAS